VTVGRRIGDILAGIAIKQLSRYCGVGVVVRCRHDCRTSESRHPCLQGSGWRLRSCDLVGLVFNGIELRLIRGYGGFVVDIRFDEVERSEDIDDDFQ
jgi:hypothetical protein